MRISTSNPAQVTHIRERASFLSSVQVEFGPVQLLGRFFLEADKILQSKGVALTMGTLEDAIATQALNDASWHSFPPMLDPRLCNADPADSYCFIGRDLSGNAVTANAGRIFLGGDTLLEWTTSGRFIYGDSAAPGRHFRFELPMPSAKIVRAPFAYSGAIWVHPNYRGSQFAGVLTRLSRAYALAHWNTKYTVGFVTNSMTDSPMAKIYGYSNIEPGIVARDLPDGSEWRGNLFWMDRTELLDELSRYMIERLPQIDSTVVGRAADQRA